MSQPTNFDMAYGVIPSDGKGPAVGPLLDRERAKELGRARGDYVIGIDIMFLADCTTEPQDGWPSHDR